MEIHHLKKALLIVIGLVFVQAAFAVDDGYVVKVDSSTVYLDWGTASGAKKGDSFQIYVAGEELKHPVTGKVLGQTKTPSGSGYLTEVQEKFSMGQLTERLGSGPKVGQRVAWKDVAAAPAAAAAVAASGPLTYAKPVHPMPQERWRSEQMKSEITNVAAGDFDGDGKKELVASFGDRVEVLRWNGQRLETLATYKNRSDRNWLTVEAFDFKGTGKDLIFAGCVPPYPNSRGKTVVLGFENGTLKKIAHGDGFVRKIERMDGKPALIWQGITLANSLNVFKPAQVVIDGEKLKPGEPFKVPRDFENDQLLGFTLGDWDKDGVEDLALLQRGERLRIWFKGSNWEASEVYGGTKAIIPMPSDMAAWVYPRLLSYTAVSGPSQLWSLRNVPSLGIRTTYMKFFDHSEMASFAWTGTTMTLMWRVPVESYVADFTLGDVLGSNAPQLWVAMQSSRSKSVLIAFDLP